MLLLLKRAETLEQPKSKLSKIGLNYFIRDQGAGKYPLFSLELNRRVKNKEACVVVVCGEAGSGKTYLAIQLARNIDKRFSAEQVVFTYADYVKELGNLRHAGIPIVFDEPSYAMGKREWYKQLNQALVKTIESQRFLVRPLIIPIININLLDKTLRNFLVIFQVHVTRRGAATVYHMKASQGEDKVYRYTLCRLKYPILDFNECPVEKEARILYNATQGKEDKRNESTCLDCKNEETCNLLRATYERKKRAIQLMRYAQDEESAKQRESKELTTDQLVEMAKPYTEMFFAGEKVDARKLRYVYHDKLGIKLAHNKAYEIKTILEMKKEEESRKT
jgi:ABC-type dipeptide/oligopeptide/nickel transport system ATPase component